MTVEQALAHAIAQYNAGQKDEAQALCQRLLQQAPTHPAVHQLLAVLSKNGVYGSLRLKRTVYLSAVSMVSTVRLTSSAAMGPIPVRSSA